MIKAAWLHIWLMVGMVFGATCYADCLSSAPAEGGSMYKATVEIHQEGSLLEIEGYCRNDTAEAADLHYDLQVVRTGVSGTATSRQSGPLKVAGGERARVSRLSLNVSSGDEWRIELEIYKDNELIDRHCILHSGESTL